MGNPLRAVVTIKELAKKAGLSIATVSYALRNNPKISAETRSRVAALAETMGYRANPRISSLMSHIRQAHARPAGECLGFIWVRTTRSRAARDPFLKKVLRGARQRAEQLGFRLEEFWAHEAGMTDKRLQQILLARGIVGVVLSPATASEAALSLALDWNCLSAAVIGNVTWEPDLHHAGHHHYLGMRRAMLELAKLGCSRPLALLDAETNRRTKNAWEAAYFVFHPTPSLAKAQLLLVDENAGPAELEPGFSTRPDALIVSSSDLLERYSLQAWAKERGLPVVTLHWNDEGQGIGGVDQCFDRIAGYAVDLVATELNLNETGAPEFPRMILFPGRWVAPSHFGQKKRQTLRS